MPISLELFADCGLCGGAQNFLLELPQLRLYANGVAIFRRGAGDSDGTYRWAQLSDDVRDELLRYALDQGGIRQARSHYASDGNDAGGYVLKFTAFYIDETPDKTVRVDRFVGNAPDPDGVIRGRLMAFADLLTSFEGWAGKHGVAVQPFASRAYTAALWPNAEAGESADWPWTDLEVADFGDREGTLLARLTPEQAAMIPAERPNSDGFAVQAPDGRRYVVAKRVILPDDDVPGAFGLRPDTAAITVTDGVRIRTLPEVSDASAKLQPLLTKGQPMYVIDGPVEGSGYSWYRVVTTAPRLEGWAAAASKAREPWLAPVPFRCTLGPGDSELGGTIGHGLMDLACFKDREFAAERRIDGAPLSDAKRREYCQQGIAPVRDPSWLGELAACNFGLRPATDEQDTGGPPDWFAGSAFHPSVLDAVKALIARSAAASRPIRVRVSGRLDHPDARSCTRTDASGMLATLLCRRILVITEIVPIQ